jgi:hypothetical protein
MDIRILSSFFNELEKIAIAGTGAPPSPSRAATATSAPASAPKVPSVSRGAGVPSPGTPQPAGPRSAVPRATTLGQNATQYAGRPGGRTMVGIVGQQRANNAPPTVSPQARAAPATTAQMAATTGVARAAAGPVVANRPATPAPAARSAAPTTGGAVTKTMVQPATNAALGTAARLTAAQLGITKPTAADFGG